MTTTSTPVSTFSSARSTAEEMALRLVLGQHAEVDVTVLAFACLECGSVGAAQSREDRDAMATVVDFTCHKGATLFFHSDAEVARSLR